MKTERYTVLIFFGFLLALVIIFVLATSMGPKRQATNGTAVSPSTQTGEPTPEPSLAVVDPGNLDPAVERRIAAMTVDLTKQEVATITSEPVDKIRLVSQQKVSWPDASLGCPKAGFVYAQVITPGYKIELELGSETFEYHTDLDRNIVLCKNTRQEEE